MVENHKLLNDLCHKLDVTRPTTMAHAFMLDMDDPFVMASDIRSYNLYYGWYLGELEQNDEWFDEFHQKHPEAVIGLSEYGADANPVYQNGHPEKGDWSEPYQAIYHEHMLKMWSERPYIWAMHCWNMFDFAADGRNEGGKPGQNQKGLVTSTARPKGCVLHLQGLFEQRAVRAYLRPPVCRPARGGHRGGKSTRTSPRSPCWWIAGNLRRRPATRFSSSRYPSRCAHDRGPQWRTLRHHRHPQGGQAQPRLFGHRREVVNWFDRPDELERAGYYSILDSMEAIKQSPAGAALLARMMAKVTASYGDVAKSVTLPAAVQRQMDKMPLQSLLKQAGKAVTPRWPSGSTTH